MKSAGFHLKSARFHEIRWISYRFHEIWRISCEIERPLQGIVTLFWNVACKVLKQLFIRHTRI